MESLQRELVTRQRNNFFVTLLMMLQVPPDHQKNFQKSLMKNITLSSKSVETGTAIFTLAEKNISLEGILEPDTQKIFSLIFIKSDLRLVIDLQTCIKAQQSEVYAQKVKLTNLKQMAQTVAYIQEHGYDSLDDFHAALDQASDQTSASRKSLKDTEQHLKEVNEQIHFTGQYLVYKNVYADYRKSRNKENFYEEHRAELSLYDTALRTLKEKSGGNKLPSMKSFYAKKDRLVELRDRQREDFSNHRDCEWELRTVSTNIDMILGKNREQKQQIEKVKDL